MANNLNERAKSLEDEFFFKEDQKLIQRLKEMKKLEENVATLSRVSGIKNEATLKKLVELNVPPSTLAAVTMIPLVEVAWADGVVQEKERTAIVDSAKKAGLDEGNLTLLTEWMAHKPEPRLFNVWALYMEGLCGELSQAQINALKVEVLGTARSISEAAGGILGLAFRTSRKEEAVLKRLDAAFKR